MLVGYYLRRDLVVVRLNGIWGSKDLGKKGGSQMSRMMLSLNAALYSDAPKDFRASIEEIVPFKVL